MDWKIPIRRSSLDKRGTLPGKRGNYNPLHRGFLYAFSHFFFKPWGDPNATHTTVNGSDGEAEGERGMHIHSLPPHQAHSLRGFISISLSSHQTPQVSLWAGLAPKGRMPHHFQSHQCFQRRCIPLGKEDCSAEGCTPAPMEKSSSNCRHRWNNSVPSGMRGGSSSKRVELSVAFMPCHSGAPEKRFVSPDLCTAEDGRFIYLFFIYLFEPADCQLLHTRWNTHLVILGPDPKLDQASRDQSRGPELSSKSWETASSSLHACQKESSSYI